MKRGIRIKQHDKTDCGAACLASVASYYSLQIPIARIRQMALTDRKGTNILGLIEAAEKLGFAAKGVKAVNADNTPKAESLSKIPKPAIAHIIVKEKLQHFVVIYGISKDKIKIMDPATGEITKRRIDDFAKEWTGALILLVPDEDFIKRNEKISVLQRFWFLFRPHKKIFL